MPHRTGKVAWFNDAKGFGFIKHDQGHLFFHRNAMGTDDRKQILEGQVVEFEMVRGTEGLEANRVRIVSAGMDMNP